MGKKSKRKGKSGGAGKKKQGGGGRAPAGGTQMPLPWDAEKQAMLENQEKGDINKRDANRDPPIKPLSEEEQADLPALLPAAESPFRTSGSMDLTSLGRQLGITVMEVNQCIACNSKKPREEFSHNQWHKQDEYGPRCHTCVKNGRFRIENPDRFWVGWPKDPMQMLWERGWIDSPRGQKPDPERYPPERIGKMVVGMPDSEYLLKCFEQAGHYGYGGLEEELCCMPGCVVDVDLQACGRCKRARYCCAEHQALHFRHHKDQCVSLAATEGSK